MKVPRPQKLRRPVRLVVALTIGAVAVWYAFCLPRQLFEAPYSTVVNDRDGNLLGARIASDGQWRFPPRRTVPDRLAECILLFEDKHYYYHPGVNPLSMARALRQNLRAQRIVSGGSTLTMQTIRLSRNRPRTTSEKLVEMILATRLELRHSKAEILALYASHAPYGGNVVGLDAAAWRYFGHSPDRLSWAEAAMLAVLPNAPSAIHLSRSRDALLEKRNRLLTRLRDAGRMDDATLSLALAEPLPDEPLALPRAAPHLTDRMHALHGGTQVSTSIDRALQLRAEEVLDRWNQEFRRSDIRHIAAFIMDVRTNEALAYCGNVGYGSDDAAGQVDIIRAPRSTGSILKPFLLCDALQEGELLPHTLLPDVPVNINGFVPRNFSLSCEGAVPASEAIARSLNIPSVQLLRQHGVPRFHAFLRRIGLTTFSRPSSHYGLSLILGGGEATLEELTRAYAAMARSLLAIEDNAFNRGAVWQVFDAIKEVNRPEELDARLLPPDRTVAWKTGTSYGFRDAWAIGVNARYAVGVWVGNASGEGRPGLVGARTAAPVLFDLFNLLPRSEWFERPEAEFVEAAVCKHSGHLAGRFCEHVDTLLILPVGLRTASCPYCNLVHLTQEGTHRVSQDCLSATPTVSLSWFTLPPTQEWFYKQHHPEYRPLPAFLPGCGPDTARPMQFLYPEPDAVLSLPRQLDGTPGSFTPELIHADPHATVYWHLDTDYLAATRDFHKLTLAPEPGRHTITVVDGEGNRLSTRITVRAVTE